MFGTFQARDLDVSVKGTEGTDRFAFKKSLPIDQVAARAKAGVVSYRNGRMQSKSYFLSPFEVANDPRLTLLPCDSQARLDGEVLPAINKSYWTEARQAMRRAMGTLRYDFNTLADAKGVAKATKPVTKATFKKVDALDFAIRSKDKEAALKAFEEAKAAVDAELSSLA